MSAAQWIALTLAALVGSGCLAGLWHEWRLTSGQTIRDAYKRSNVPYDDAELAAQIAADEQAWAEWVAICNVIGIAPDGGSPIFDRLVCEEMERLNGWAS